MSAVDLVAEEPASIFTAFVHEPNFWRTPAEGTRSFVISNWILSRALNQREGRELEEGREREREGEQVQREGMRERTVTERGNKRENRYRERE